MSVITVEIYGDEKDEHSTYVKNKEAYMRFYTDGYDGTTAREIINLLKFIGHDVFVVNHNHNDHFTGRCCNATDFI